MKWVIPHKVPKNLSSLAFGSFLMALSPELWNGGLHRLGNLRFGPAFAEAPAIRKASGGGTTRRQVQSFPREPSLRARFCFDVVFDFFKPFSILLQSCRSL